MTKPEKIRLGEILIKQGLLTEEQVKAALEQQKRSGRKLGRVFIECGFVREEQLSQALANQLGISYIDLKHYNVNPDIVRKLPEAQARRFRALVLEDRKTSYLVATPDPTDMFAYDEIVRLLKRDIDLAVVNEDTLLEIIDRTYRRTQEISGLARELQADLGAGQVDFTSLGVDLGAEDAPVVKLLQSLFEDATQVGASDIHIEPQETKLLIRFRIDGLLHLQTEADLRISSAMALRLKLMSSLDISEKRLPQDGRFSVKVRGVSVDVRMSTMPTQHGESVVMRLLNQGTGLLGLQKIGMPETMLTRFREIIARVNGMVLVTGPTGSGKTTTLYAALSEMNTVDKKILTVEDPVEYRLPGINQVQVNEKIELTFSRVLRSIMRQDPDIILVGEMRDQETAEIGLRAAITGHMVLSTLHTRDAASTPLRLIDMGAPSYMVSSALQAVLAQRLVRLICESCATPHTPDAHEAEWLRHEIRHEGMPEKSGARGQIMQGRGCSRCNQTGYRGRNGVFEMLEMTQPLMEAAGRGDPVAFSHLAQQQMAGKTLRHHGLDMVFAGKTTLFEVMRITTQAED